MNRENIKLQNWSHQRNYQNGCQKKKPETRECMKQDTEKSITTDKAATSGFSGKNRKIIKRIKLSDKAELRWNQSQHIN